MYGIVISIEKNHFIIIKMAPTVKKEVPIIFDLEFFEFLSYMIRLPAGQMH